MFLQPIELSSDQRLDFHKSSKLPITGIRKLTLALAKFKGGEAALLEATVYGMFAGEGNDSGIISIADANVALSNRDAVGYEVSDYNLSGIVTISDVNLSDSNRDAATKVN